MRLLALALVLVVACGSKSEPVAGSAGSGSAERPSHMPAPKFEVVLDGVPDESDWKAAASVVANGWAESFNRLEVTRATIAPLTSPDGTIAKYLLRAKAVKGPSTLFEGVALVSENRMINGSGPRRLEVHLANIKFPAAKLSAHHLVEMVFVTATVKGAWFKQPSASGWDLAGALLSYDDRGALLTLRKSTAAQVTVRFDAAARITVTE